MCEGDTSHSILTLVPSSVGKLKVRMRPTVRRDLVACVEYLLNSWYIDGLVVDASVYQPVRQDARGRLISWLTVVPVYRE